MRPKPPLPSLGRWLLHLALFALTFATTTFFGGLMFASPGWLDSFERSHSLPPGTILWRLATDLHLWSEGVALSLPLMAILLAHEMGHYLACRHHRLDASLPFFIPVPFGIGTLGAFIRIRSPLVSKRELVDVGASGPLAGFLVTLPVLVWGIQKSQVVYELPQGGYLVFGEPLLFKLTAHLLHPALGSGADLLLHPTAYAGWFGLLITALNLLPFGQLDGGHIAYAIFGRLHRVLAWPLLLLLVALGFLWTGWWVWAVVALIMGVRHPWVPGEAEPFPAERKWLAAASWLVFALSFAPEPVKVVP
ncbi:MAG: site-2 protease family protein [Thermoanaerobaculum sp.]|nr:site-2 protease family protein [Thermoanaerobaculum sp.]MDW7968465.1 site-2 protease family protein [Thermoanaerobaculum sp.]